jgi:two-component system chemotaxis response regulator CheY
MEYGARHRLIIRVVALSVVPQQSETPCRLLAIDDHPLSTDLIVRIARRCGYDAQGLVETRALAELLVKWRPDVITLDLNMPRADGSDVLTMLKVVGYQGQVIIISGLHPTARERARQQAETFGLKVAGTLGKPVDLKGLRDLLGELNPNPKAATA